MSIGADALQRKRNNHEEGTSERLQLCFVLRRPSLLLLLFLRILRRRIGSSYLPTTKFLHDGYATHLSDCQRWRQLWGGSLTLFRRTHCRSALIPFSTIKQPVSLLKLLPALCIVESHNFVSVTMSYCPLFLALTSVHIESAALSLRQRHQVTVAGVLFYWLRIPFPFACSCRMSQQWHWVHWLRSETPSRSLVQ
jgi:hypothetical protein